jgi:hypothetical protein
MTKWWMGAAVAALFLGQATTTRAQYAPQGGAMPEPTPLCPSGAGAMTPGPLNSQMAPPGPADCLGLPASVPGAFDDRCEAPERAWYAAAGVQALQRQKLGNHFLGIIDPSNLDTGFPFGILPRNVQPGFNLSELKNNMMFGPSATVGYMCDNHSIEVTGFYIPENESSVDFKSPGKIDAFFFNPPVGFEGNNGLWAQADRLRASLRTTMANGEVNYRYWDKAVTGAELILGARYLFLRERLAIFTDDEGLTVHDFVFNLPDPTRQANYQTEVNNNLVLGQIGFEWQHPLCCWLSLGMNGKAGWGVNIFNMNTLLARGDGLLGAQSHHSDTFFASLYEFGAFADVLLSERMKLRIGYDLMWIVHLPDAESQLNFDLSQPAHVINENGSILYHGPMVQLQFLF